MTITVQIQFKCTWHGGLVFVTKQFTVDDIPTHHLNADDYRMCDACRTQVYRANHGRTPPTSSTP